MMTTDFIANAKKCDIPAPGAYEVDKVINKPILGFTTVSEKATYHVDEAVHYAKQTPTICYKDIGSLTTMIKPRCKYTKIFEVKETAQEANRIKPKKTHEPDVGSYEAPKAKDYLENKTGYSGKVTPSPFVRFYEPNLKQRKYVPAPSHYKVTSEHFNRLSKSPPSLRTRRH